MGPGYFPLALGGILVLLGLLIMGKGFIPGSGAEERLGSVPWRALVLIVLAVLFFGLTVRGLGLVPATAVTALLTALASSRTSILAAVAIAAGLTVLCVLIFVVALQLGCPCSVRGCRSRLGAQMELLDNLALGLGTALQPENVLYCLIGVVLGTAVGVLPGIGPTATSRCCCRSPSAWSRSPR